MEIFKIEGGHVSVNHHSRLLFPLQNPTKTTYCDPSNWVYDDDIDKEIVELGPLPKRGNAGGGDRGASALGATPPDEMLDPQ